MRYDSRDFSIEAEAERERSEDSIARFERFGMVVEARRCQGCDEMRETVTAAGWEDGAAVQYCAECVEAAARLATGA